MEERGDRAIALGFFDGVHLGHQALLRRAAEHLTPAVLELGGKSPCIIDETADLKTAAKRLAFGKFLNAGQTCVAPDYLLIDKSVKDRFLMLYFRAVENMYGRDPLENPDYGKIINQKHLLYNCCLALIKLYIIFCFKKFMNILFFIIIHSLFL